MLRRISQAAAAAVIIVSTTLVSAGPAMASFDFCAYDLNIVSPASGAASTERQYTGTNANMLRARGSYGEGPWEQYTICWLDDNSEEVAILSQSANRWVSAEYGYAGSRNGMLRARATEIGPWETFRIYCVDDGDRVVIAGARSFVADERDYTGTNRGMLRSRSSSIGPWEKFGIVDSRSGELRHIYFPSIEGGLCFDW